MLKFFIHNPPYATLRTVAQKGGFYVLLFTAIVFLFFRFSLNF